MPIPGAESSTLISLQFFPDVLIQKPRSTFRDYKDGQGAMDRNTE